MMLPPHRRAASARPPLPFALILGLALPAAASMDGRDATELEDEQGPSRVERLANQFTMSSQDRVALERNAAGELVLVWQSRRQEEGSYGVRARRFDAAGDPLGDEVQVNATTRGMQMEPAISADGQGGLWFAWASYGQDGDRGSIVARRFDGELRTAAREVVANDLTVGDQRHAAVVGLAGGGALVLWTHPAETEGTSELRARRFSADGEPAGASFRIAEARGVRDQLAVAGRDEAGRVVVAWARAGADGLPLGVFARRFDAELAPLCGELRVDADGGGVEPALALTPAGEARIAWLEPEGEGYGLRVRALRFGEEDAQLGELRRVEAPGEGWTSGHGIAVDADGRALLAWTRYGDGETREGGLFACLLGPEGTPVAGHFGEPFRVTARSEGAQAFSTGVSARRVLLDEAGRMAFAWHGDAGLGDSSGAHLSLLAPAGVEPKVASGAPAEHAPIAFAEPESDAEGDEARPHDPPTYDPRAAMPPQVDINLDPTAGGTDFDFLAVTNTGWTPPDPHMAVGPNHVVVMTNGEIAFFDKKGNNLFRDEIEASFGFWGQQGATGFVFDPETIYDPHSGRFMAMACERGSNGRPYYLLAVSDDSNPVGTWHKYRIDVLVAAGDNDIDSPNIAVDEDVIYLSADFFGPDKLNVLMVDKSSVLGGGAISFTALNIVGDQSQGLPVTYDTGAPAQYMIGFNFSTSTQVRMYAIQNPLTTPSFQTTTVTVPSYSHPEDPPQAGTSSRPETFEARFWNAVYRDGSLWATHHVNSSRVRQRWYEFAMNGWPTSGQQPALVQSGEVDLGGTLRTFFGSIWADEDGNMALTYARSSPTEFISMERTFRLAGDPPGTTRPPVSVISSTSAETSGRWGDYSQIVDDPSDPATFWAHHEYRTSGWLTRVARFSVCDGDVTNYCVGAPNSVGPGAVIGSFGSTSIAANDFGLFASGCPPFQNGLFFYGPTPTNVAFGNGFLCVGAPLVRLGIQQIDSFGVATRPIDFPSLPPGGQITAFSTWYFQFWYRDPAAGGAAFNLSDGLDASFCP